MEPTNEDIKINDIKIIDKRMVETPETSIQVQDNSPASIMIAAMSKGMDPDKLERFMELQEKWEKNEAKKAFVVDMARFKADAPEILKTAHVSYLNSKNQTVEWDHAELGEIAEAAIPKLSKYNFYHNWKREKKDGLIYVTCIITHSLGHSEDVTMEGPPDTSGGKDTLKAESSTNTFLQRLTFLAVTGLSAKGMDRESIPDPPAYITEAQAKILNDIIKNKNVDSSQFLNYMKVEKVEDIMPQDFPKAMQALKIAKGKPKVVMCPNTEKNVPISDCEGCEGRKGCPNHD